MKDGTLDGLLAAGARRGRHIAVIDGDQRASLTRFDAHVTTLAAALCRSGIGAGDRVAIEMTSGLDALACLFAVLRAGGTVVPVNSQAADQALHRWLAMAGVRAVISAENDSARRTALALASSVQVTELRSGTVAAMLSTRAAPDPAGPALASHGPRDLAGIFITTGTTGDGALVRHTHASLVASVRALEAMRRDYFRAGGRAVIGNLAQIALSYRGKMRWAAGRQTWLTPMPLHSIAGMRFMMQAILTGQRLVVMPTFHPRALLAEVARHRVNIVALTPTMLEAVLAVWPRARDDVSSVLAIGLGAAPASAGLIRRASEAFGCPVLNGYGSTETGGGILAARIGGAPDGNVGYPFPGTEVRVVDPAGAVVPDGTAGELICRTPTLGTADDRGTGTDGWYHTGDLARVGGRGEIHIVGRCRDLIIRGGMKIVPAAVEKALCADPSVGACAVVGMPDQLAGERIVAFVVPADRREPDTAGLVAGCRARLAAHEVPDHVLIVPDLPRAESGEVRKAELRTLAVHALRREARAETVSQRGAVE